MKILKKDEINYIIINDQVKFVQDCTLLLVVHILVSNPSYISTSHRCIQTYTSTYNFLTWAS